MDGGHAQAAGLMRAQRYGDAIPLLIAACGASNAARQCWVDLGRCLIETGQHTGLFGLIEKRQAIAGDGPRLFYDCLISALVSARGEPLLGMIAATPRNSVLFIIALYVSGLFACQGAEAQRGIDEIKLASAAAQSCAEHFEKDAALQAILYDADVLEPFDTIAAIEAADRATIFAGGDEIAPAADFGDAAPPSRVDAPFVFLAGCSEPYLDRFGAGIVTALDCVGVRTVLHFHVADPSPAIDHKIARLRAACRHVDLRLSTEFYRSQRDGYHRASFYACSRLIRLPEILAHYDRDVMMWDMDVEAVHGVERNDASP